MLKQTDIVKLKKLEHKMKLQYFTRAEIIELNFLLERS